MDRRLIWRDSVDRNGIETPVSVIAHVYVPRVPSEDDYPETEVWCDELELTADECSWFEEKAERLARGET
jgi:hypothetical protein